ncbi:MAG: HPF/RaiA family ribosome-associated protein [Gramella sp.]|nr:HPF/RaiA family ribosome-associated protein [Christiangramia sp.]
MLLQIQNIKIPPSAALDQYTRAKLAKIIDRYKIIKNLEVYFKFENKSPDNSRICEIECAIPGGRIHARASKKYYEEAVNKAIVEISRQLEKKKDSITTY